jgi:xanthine dehydrogenase small subunit
MPASNTLVRFMLGSRPTELDLNNHPVYQPSTTVLNYLRSLSDRKGVKEGCAEGDCGACTVVVASPDSNGKLRYQAVNSCLVFLPWLHGKQLITIEDLSKGKALHPVQQLMVDLYGSQCGFCTPGIVMSIFALFKSRKEPTRENAVQALSGNLCRCTGYQPILEAAIKALEADGKDFFSLTEKTVLDQLMPLQAQSIALDNGKQCYFRPSTLEEALLLRHSHPDALLTTGATDLALRQSKKHEFLPKILDISGLEELKTFQEKEDGWVIGSGLPLEDLWHLSDHKIPMFDEVFSVFASHQIRNMATLGGNIGSASPIGDTLPVLIALEASLELENSSSKRSLPIGKFITGYRKTELLPDEIIRSVFIPKSPGNSIFKFLKVSKRRELDISTVSLAARIKLSHDKRIEDVILAYGGMADRPMRASKAESWLNGKIWDHSVANSAAEIILSEFSPISDARAGKEARNIIARNLFLKLFVETSSNGAENE